MNLDHFLNSTNWHFLNSLKVILIIFLIKVPLESPGQSISPQLLSSGSIENNFSDVILSHSIGEIAITTIQSSVIITQGFLQPENFNPCIEFTLVAFPNPVSDVLNFRFEGCDDKVGRIMLLDLFGKIIIDFDVRDDQISLDELKNGIYILKAFNPSGKDVGTVKVAKISR